MRKPREQESKGARAREQNEQAREACTDENVIK
jgi:hypothetical protein